MKTFPGLKEKKGNLFVREQFDTYSYLMPCATKIRYLAKNVEIQSFIADIKRGEGKLYH